MDRVKHKFTSVDEYIDSFSPEVKELLVSIRKIISEEIPNAEQVISYNIPCFKFNGNYIIYFSGWKNHIALYPFSSDMQKAFKESVNYNTSGKGTIQFKLTDPLPLKFIRKIVQFRLKETTKVSKI